MSRELEPCPFCGVVEEETYTEHSEGCYIRKLCDLVYEPDSTSEATHGEEAMRNAYNTRCKRTCQNMMPPSEKTNLCSECGCVTECYDVEEDIQPKFCANCGAEVADE